MIFQNEPTEVVEIFMAGDIILARPTLRRYCYEVGLCVTLTETDYIYTGGEERGFAVGLRNYPRFPSSKDLLRDHAETLALRLIEDLNQNSAMIVGRDTTHWLSRREHD